MPRETRDIRALEGKRSGETAFILANGPSLREHALERLRGKLVIGMNASTLLEKEHGFVSSYYVVSDARFLSHPDKRAYATTSLSPETTRVLRGDLCPLDEPALQISTYYVRSLGKNGFSHDLHEGFYFGCTTSMLAIQLAAYLGCKRIVLLGNDLRYPPGQPRFYAEAVPQAHDPFMSIQIWNVRNAFVALRPRGVSMCICTRSSNLTPYIPYRDFEEVLEP